jgi:TPR repeat protein
MKLLMYLFLMLVALTVPLRGQQVPVDPVKKFAEIKAKAEAGDANAQSILGFRYETGDGVLQDYTKAVQWYTKSAGQGDIVAQYNLALHFHDGLGVAQDYAEAAMWYRKVADQGFGAAQINLGNCYHNGQGVTQDDAEAVKWFRKAADQGYAKAQFNLGFCYDDGQGVTQDYAEAVKWYRKAADQGFPDAQFELAFCYDNGQGVTQDYAEAVKWYRRAADQGYAGAQILLGNCYHHGQGVTQDDAEAVKWYRKAADQGVAEAQFNLGICYYKGEGVTQDYVEAYQWLNLSAAKGFADAPRGRDIVSRQMTQSQIAEGQRLAAAFVQRKETPQNHGAVDNSSVSPGNYTATATGFFITDDGYLISNYHVVKNATRIRLITTAGTIDATVVKVDMANDLALLKASGKFAPLPVAASRSVKLGGTVVTVGFPDIGLQGFSPKMAKGEIASLAGAADDPRYFQISVPVQPGNSGGALVDEHGNTVGIVAAKLDAKTALDATGALPENVNYAVKSSFLLGFLESVPDVANKLKDPNTKSEPFEDVIKSAQDAAVLLQVY